MATQELYIRNASETEARGPFSVQQVVDLAEAGQVTGDTLIYDAETEQWLAINAKPELKAQIFPEKKKYALKNTEFKTLNKPAENAKEISVRDMLDAAEGRTADTKHKANPEIAMARAARIGTLAAIATCVLAAASEILPATEAITNFSAAKLLAHPLVILGALDIVLAVFLSLGVVTLYPLVRFRAAMGLGLVGFIFYVQGMPLQIVELILGCAGLYICTVVVSIMPAVVAGAAGIVGMGLLTWYSLVH